MGIFSAIKTRVLKTADDLGEKITDPVAEVEQAIKKREGDIQQFQLEIAGLKKSKIRKDRDLADTQRRVADLENAANRFLDHENEEKARMALEQQVTAKEIVATLKAEVAKDEQLLNQLMERLNAAKKQNASDRADLQRFRAQHEGAKVRQRIAKSTSAIQPDGVNSALERLENRTKDLEAGAEALESFEEEPDADDLIAEAKAGAKPSADDLLAKLKAKRNEA